MIRMAMVVLLALGLAGVAHAAQTSARRSPSASEATAGTLVNLNTANIARPDERKPLREIEEFDITNRPAAPPPQSTSGRSSRPPGHTLSPSSRAAFS